GYLRGGRSREKAGLAVGTGPYRVVTDLGLFDFEPASRRMRLIALNPGVGLSEAKAASEFSFLTAKTIIKNEPPTEVELKLLREELDREKIFRKTLAV
ncbi:MAG: 3-oxoadipate--succinyl-CoA transferase subunit B, partial [Elusimicrobiota bacterium]